LDVHCIKFVASKVTCIAKKDMGIILLAFEFLLWVISILVLIDKYLWKKENANFMHVWLEDGVPWW
jgi:hypothetical protein